MSTRRVAQHTFFNFLTIGLNAFTGLVVTAVIARWLGPQANGTYSLVTWLFTIAGLLVNLGFVTTTMKYMAEALGREDLQEAGATLAYGARRLVINGAVVTAGWVAASPLFDRLYDHERLWGYLLVASVAIVPSSLMALLMAACQGLQRYGVVAAATALYTLLMATGSVAALALGAGIFGLLGVQAAAASAACALYGWFLHGWQPGWWRLRLAPGRRSVLRGYSGSLMILLLLDAIVWQRSGVFFLGLWAPAAEVGYYALAFSLSAMAMRMIPGTLLGLLIPSMSRSFGAGELGAVRHTYRLASRWMAVLAMPVAVGGAVLAPALVSTLYGPAYAPMAPLLAVLLAAGAMVMTFGFPASSVLYALEGQRHLVRTGFVVGLFNLVLALVLIPRFGALGAAVVTALSQLASLVPGAYYADRMLGGARPDVRALPAVLAAAAGMGALVWPLTLWLPDALALALGVPAGALAYGVGLWAFGAFAPDERARLRALAAKLPVVGRFAIARV